MRHHDQAGLADAREQIGRDDAAMLDAMAVIRAWMLGERPLKRRHHHVNLPVAIGVDGRLQAGFVNGQNQLVEFCL